MMLYSFLWENRVFNKWFYKNHMKTPKSAIELAVR